MCEKGQENCQISYKNKDNNQSSSSIDANFKMNQMMGMTANKCLTL